MHFTPRSWGSPGDEHASEQARKNEKKSDLRGKIPTQNPPNGLFPNVSLLGKLFT